MVVGARIGVEDRLNIACFVRNNSVSVHYTVQVNYGRREDVI